MVERISVQIALEGGRQVEQQLEGIGEAGKKAFEDITRAAEKAGGFKELKPEQINKELEKLGTTGVESIHKIQGAIRTAVHFENLVVGIRAAEAALAGAARAAIALGVALAPIAAIAAVIAVALGKGMLEAAEAISKVDREAIKLGASIEQFDKIRAGLSRAGIGVDAIRQGLQRFRTELDRINLERVQRAFEAASKRDFGPTVEQLKLLRNAADGVGPAAEAARRALDQLGVPFRDTVTPAFEDMVRWAGSAAKAIPWISLELSKLSSAGERARFITLTLEQLAAEAGGVVPAIEQIVRALQQMPDSLERNNAILKLFGEQLGTELIQALRTGSVDIAQFRTNLTQGTADAANRIEQNLNKIKAAFSEALTTLPLETVSRGLESVSRTVQATADRLGQISWGTFTTNAVASFATVNTAIGEVTSNVTGPLTSSWSGAGSAATGAIGSINSSLDGMLSRLDQAISKLGQLNVGGGGGGGGNGGIPFAGGGIVGGRGTGTSDSNLVWVSRGEHIMPARTVGQPGVLALLEALRRSGGNLSRVLDGMGRFAMGGVVPRHALAFADGGVVGGGSMRNLGRLELVTSRAVVSGLVDETIFRALERMAVQSQSASGGRRPSWKK